MGVERKVVVELDRSLVLRDGTRTAIDVYRPDDDRRYPVLLHRTPYSKTGTPASLDPLVAVRAGYVVVRQESRGRGGSEGTFRPFRDEQDDGYDSVEWAAAQSWSTGAVGLFGESGIGANAVQTALAAPPHLRCLVGVHTGFNPYSGWVYSGGALELAFLHGWVRRFALSAPGGEGRSSELTEELLRWSDDPRAVLDRLPLDAAFSKELAPYFQEWLEHPTYDDYWASLDAIAQVERIRVPVLHITGWYDGFVLSHLDFQRALQDHPDPIVAKGSQLLVGPWDHDAFLAPLTSSFAGDRDFGVQALSGRSTYEPRLLRFFDRWLKNEEPAERSAAVRYYVMGERRWAEVEAWPPPGGTMELFLDSQGAANTRRGDGVLVGEPRDESPSDGFRYDPADPAPTVGGRHLGTGSAAAGVRDRSRVQDRDDVLVYTGDVLVDPVAVAGRVSVRLFAESSAHDTDFCATLVDLGPDGYRANVAEGLTRLRHVGAQGRPRELLDLTVDCWDTAYTFLPGHRIVLEVTSSDYPRHDRNLNTDASETAATLADAVVAEQRIHHDRARPSRLVLPVTEVGR